MDAVHSTSPKILSDTALARLRTDAARRGLRVVQCHGCFDLVHPGHVRHLQWARRQGDILLVSITGDAGVNKGDGRPLFGQDLRAENLAALDCVDWVYVNPEATAEGLLERTRPDLYVKGKEYQSNNDPRFAAEREAVEQHGGRVVFSSGDVVFSSTALIEAIDRSDAGVSEDPTRVALRLFRERFAVDGQAIGGWLERMRGQRVVVVGEPIIDTYVHCDRPDAAGEAAMLSLTPIREDRFDGGAAVIALHAAALGAKPTLLTALPKSTEAEALRERLVASGVEVVAVESDTPIAEKQRFLVGRDKVVKIDRVHRQSLDAATVRSLVGLAGELASNTDLALLADFGLGMLGPRTLGDVCAAVRRGARIVGGDVSGKRTALSSMHEVDWLSPAENELREAARDYDASLPAVVWSIMHTTGARIVAPTLGGEGMIAFERTPSADDAEGEWSNRVAGEPIPALNRHPVDVLGCGDALLAAATLAVAAGAPTAVSAYIGSLAASVQAMRPGNRPVGSNLVLDEARRHDDAKLVVRQAKLVG